VTALGDGTVISGVPGVLRTPLGDCTPPSTRPGLLGIGVPCFPCVSQTLSKWKLSWLHWQLIVHRSNTVLVYELVGDDNSAALVTALTLQFNKPHWCKTKVSTLKAYRGQVIYWKAGKLHIVGLDLDWTFYWWWLASILNALVPQVNIFRVLTFLVDESMPRRGLKAWFHLLRARTVIASRTVILSSCSSITAGWLV